MEPAKYYKLTEDIRAEFDMRAESLIDASRELLKRCLASGGIKQRNEDKERKYNDLASLCLVYDELLADMKLYDVEQLSKISKFQLLLEKDKLAAEQEKCKDRSAKEAESKRPFKEWSYIYRSPGMIAQDQGNIEAGDRSVKHVDESLSVSLGIQADDSFDTLKLLRESISTEAREKTKQVLENLQHHEDILRLIMMEMINNGLERVGDRSIRDIQMALDEVCQLRIFIQDSVQVEFVDLPRTVPIRSKNIRRAIPLTNSDDDIEYAPGDVQKVEADQIYLQWLRYYINNKHSFDICNCIYSISGIITTFVNSPVTHPTDCFFFSLARLVLIPTNADVIIVNYKNASSCYSLSQSERKEWSGPENYVIEVSRMLQRHIYMADIEHPVSVSAWIIADNAPVLSYTYSLSDKRLEICRNNIRIGYLGC